MASKAKQPKITVRKYDGDDCYSWAVFRDGRPVFTGLSRSQANHYRKAAQEGYAESATPPFRGPLGL